MQSARWGARAGDARDGARWMSVSNRCMFAVGALVDRCESVRGSGIPRSYHAVRIVARGYGLVTCAGRRWCVGALSTRIVLLPIGQRSILIHTTGLGGGASLRYALPESHIEALASPTIHRTATPITTTLKRLVV